MAKLPETIIEWEAPEFRHYPKNAAWLITYIIVTALLVFYQVFQQDWFGTISVSIIAIMLGIFAFHRPKMVTVKISTFGIHIDDTHIPFNNIKLFWIVENEHHKTLNIETTAYLNHSLAIELHEQDADEVQEILEELLPEKEDKSETPAQIISHRLKF